MRLELAAEEADKDGEEAGKDWSTEARRLRMVTMCLLDNLCLEPQHLWTNSHDV